MNYRRSVGAISVALLIFASLSSLARALASKSSADGDFSYTDVSSLSRKSVPDRIYDLTGPNPARSLKELNEYISKHPNAVDGYIHRGQAYLNDGDVDNALKDMNKAKSIDPGHGPTYIGLARVFEGFGKLDLAFDALAKAKKIGPADVAVGAMWETAFINRQLRRFDLAISQYTEVIKSTSLSKLRRAFAIFQRGETYQRMGKQALALSDFDAASALDQDLYLVHMMKARSLSGLGKTPQSISEYTKAIQIESRMFTDAAGLDLFGSHIPALYTERAQQYRALGKHDLEMSDIHAADRYRHGSLDSTPFRMGP